MPIEAVLIVVDKPQNLKQKALAAGGDGYIAMPIDVETLPLAVAGYLEAGGADGG